MKYLESDVLDQLNAALTLVDRPDCKAVGRIEAYSCKSVGTDKKLFKRLEIKYQEDSSAVQQAVQQQQQQQQRHSISIQRQAPGGNQSAVGASYDSDLNASSTSPDFSYLSDVVSPLGPMRDQQSRKTLFYLIGTLNAAFPDYDFSNVKPDHFKKHSWAEAIKAIRTHFFGLGGDQLSEQMTRQLFLALDQVIGETAFKEAQSAWSHSHVLNGPSGIAHPHPTHHATPGRPLSSLGHSFGSGPKANSEWEQEIDIFSYEPDEGSGAGDPYDEEDVDDDEQSGGGNIWSFHYFFFNRKLKRIVFFTMRCTSTTREASSQPNLVGYQSDEVGSFFPGGGFEEDHQLSQPRADFQPRTGRPERADVELAPSEVPLGTTEITVVRRERSASKRKRDGPREGEPGSPRLRKTSLTAKPMVTEVL